MTTPSIRSIGQNDQIGLNQVLDDKDTFEPAYTFILRPLKSLKRVQAQHGVFTYHRYNDQDGQFNPLEEEPFFKNHITEIVIPQQRKYSLIYELARLGINHMTLFPDLDGLCKHIMMDFQ